MQRIVIVEDDKKLRKELEIFLVKNGYEVEGIADFEHPIESIINCQANLILLDINLPNFDGQYICKELRKITDTPIIMITSKDTELDELLSINYGADDFVTKPFNTQILLARIASILKRMNRTSQNQNTISCDSFIINISKSTIENNQQIVELTKNELKILYYLASKKNTIVSREDIMTYLWDSEMFVDDNTLTVNINRLRKKLEEIGVEDAIETRRGQGYLLK